MAEAKYTEEDLDRIVNKRLKEQADNIRQLNVESELKKITRRLDESNHIKSEMVTKVEFHQATETLLETMSNTYIKKSEVDVLSQEAIERFGEVAGLTTDQIKMLPVLVKDRVDADRRKERRQKWHETLWGRAAIVAAIIVALLQLGELILAFQNYLSLHSH